MSNDCLLLLAMVLCLAACKPQAPADEPDQTSASEEGERPVEADPAPPDPAETLSNRITALMEGHYTAAISAHNAVVRGDLDGLRYHLDRLHQAALPPGAPADWAPTYARLQETAGRGAAVTDLVGAAAVVGSVAEACGNCHVAAGAAALYPPQAEPEGTGLQGAMHSHLWASERLWQGVVDPSGGGWDLGAQHLLDTQVFEGVADSMHISEEVLVREAFLREIGREALQTSSLEARGELYGRVLTSCAGCHTEFGVNVGE